jgi:hypothetical protein
MPGWAEVLFSFSLAIPLTLLVVVVLLTYFYRRLSRVRVD